MRIHKKDKEDFEKLVNTLTKKGMNESPENLSLHSRLPRQRVRELLLKYPSQIREQTGAYYHFDAFSAARTGRGIDTSSHPRFSGVLRESKIKKSHKKSKNRQLIENCVRQVLKEQIIGKNDALELKNILQKIKEEALEHTVFKMAKFGSSLISNDGKIINPEKLKDVIEKISRVPDPSVRMFVDDALEYFHRIQEAKYQGRDVELNKPMKSDRDEKAKKVYVKDGDKVTVVHFGDPNMPDRQDNPDAKKNFCARHNCDSANDKTSAKYWSCKEWEC